MVDALTASTKLDLVVLPEAVDGSVPDVDRDDPQDTDVCDAREFVADLARATGAHVIGGSVVRRDDHGRITNTCFVADRAGRIVGEYAKRKLFATEADRRTPGRTPGVFDLGDLRVGVLICSDLWHPELARELAGRVDVLCVPAKTTVASSEFVAYARTLWWSMAMTRSVENVLPLVVADWCEQAHPTVYTSGGSSVNDPSGRPDVDRLQHRLETGRPGHLVCQIDLDAVAQIRQYREAVGLLTRNGSAD